MRTQHKCLKALNLLRVVANTKWGSGEKTLLHLYRSLIRSKLEYGAVVYGSARKSYLRMLDPIQNQALRTCLGAFRTSPVTSLHAEANEIPRSEMQNALLGILLESKLKCAQPGLLQHPQPSVY